MPFYKPISFGSKTFKTIRMLFFISISNVSKIVISIMTKIPFYSISSANLEMNHTNSLCWIKTENVTILYGSLFVGIAESRRTIKISGRLYFHSHSITMNVNINAPRLIYAFELA